MGLCYECLFYEECRFKKGNFDGNISKTTVIDGIEVCLEEDAIVSLDKFNDYFAKIKPLIEDYIDKNKYSLYELECRHISQKTDKKESFIYQIFDKYRGNHGYTDLSFGKARNLDIGKGIYSLLESIKEILEYIENTNKEE